MKFNNYQNIKKINNKFQTILNVIVENFKFKNFDFYIEFVRQFFNIIFEFKNDIRQYKFFFRKINFKIANLNIELIFL